MSVDVRTIESGVWTAVKSFLGSELAEAAGKNERLVADLGLDSLEVAEIVSDVGRRLHLTIDPGMLARRVASRSRSPSDLAGPLDGSGCARDDAALSGVTIGILLEVAVDTAQGAPETA